MTAYVSFVAITNLLLGMALARYLSPAIVAPCVTGSRKTAKISPPRLVNEELVTEVKSDGLTVPALLEPHGGGTSATAHDESATPTVVALWNEFAEQLRDVSERIHYCRTAQDASLAEQAAARLKSFVREWYAQFEECLHREQPMEASQSASPGQRLSAVEMFAAQLETTLSNIDSLDYAQPVDDVLDVLTRELETLDEQRRNFSQCAERET